MLHRIAFLLLVLAALGGGVAGCGDSTKSDSDKKESKSTSKASSKSHDPDKLLHDYLQAMNAGDSSFESITKAMDAKDQAGVEQALKEFMHADDTLVDIGNESARSIDCAQPGSRTAVLIADDWKGDGSNLLGLVDDMRFVGFSEKNGEDEGYVTGECGKGVVGKLDPISSAEMKKAGMGEIDAESNEDADDEDESPAGVAKTNAMSIYQTIESCAAGTINGTLIDGDFKCTDAKSITDAEPSLAALLEEDSCGENPCVVVSDATDNAYTVTSYTESGPENVYIIKRSDTELFKTCEGPACPTGKW